MLFVFLRLDLENFRDNFSDEVTLNGRRLKSPIIVFSEQNIRPDWPICQRCGLPTSLQAVTDRIEPGQAKRPVPKCRLMFDKPTTRHVKLNSSRH